MTDLASLTDLVRRSWAAPADRGAQLGQAVSSSLTPARAVSSPVAPARAVSSPVVPARAVSSPVAPARAVSSPVTPARAGSSPAQQQRQQSSAQLLLIDGPSGSGKSTLADEVHASLGDTGAVLIRMDEIYPGWGGLDAATTILARDVLSPWRRGEPAGHARWDWEADTQAGWRDIPAGRPLIVEGCGAASGWVDDPATVLVWVEASDDTRKRRALERDAGTFDAHWEMWDAQWHRYLARADYRAHADAVIRTD